MNFRIEPIPSALVNQVRQNMVSPQYKSLPAIASIADGYGPCRSCLRVFDQGTDRRIYFTYNPFEGLLSLPAPGPVFIHAEDCGTFQGDFPVDILDLPVYFEAFGEDSRMITRERMDKGRFDEQLTRLLSLPDVKFVNLRNAEAGCHIAKAFPVGLM
jgi:hypothetical protein